MSRIAPLALGVSLGMAALTACALPALAQRGGGHGGGGGLGMRGGGGGGFGGARLGGGGFGGARVGMVGMRPGFAGRPGFAPRVGFAGARFAPGFSPRAGVIARTGFAGRPVAFNRFNRVRWGNRGWWRPGLGVGLGVGLASAPFWGWDDAYYASPIINVGFDGGYAGFGGIGGYCATPARTCQLFDPAPIGTGCSCQVSGGRARGVVSP